MMAENRGRTMPHIMPPSDPDPSATMLDLFRRQVAARPDAVAVERGADTLSYRALDRAGARIAQALTAHGIGAEDIVAVDLPRGPDLIAALLGVLQAGGAYLALDPDVPAKRRRALIADSGAKAILGDARAPDDAGLPCLRVPNDTSEPPPEIAPPEIAPPGPLGAEGLAYLCYTSGSTGQPKGVAVPHRAVVRLVSGDFIRFGPDETFLALAPVGFDASTLEIWGPLLTGGRLVFYPPGPFDPKTLSEVLRAGGVTTLWLTAELFHRMVTTDLDALSGLGQMIAGGDVLQPAQINRFLARYPNTRLVNGYGPTENTTFTTCHRIAAPVAGAVPIGTPIAGTEARLYAEGLTPLGADRPGELCAAGQGLARGYLGRPAATAARFLPDPNGPPGGRLYATGDIATRDPAGVFHFQGRRDAQIKLRGVRIEPAEIERAALDVPGVRNVAVVVQDDPPRGKRLVGHLVAAPEAGDPGTLAARVRRHLSATKPVAMVPSAFAIHGALPVTANGKLDRAALRLPARAPRDADLPYVPPETPQETLLCDIWADLLDLDRVGATDDFYEIGGNSLIAVDLIQQIETVFDRPLSIRMLLWHPTVRDLARAMDAETASTTHAGTPGAPA